MTNNNTQPIRRRGRPARNAAPVDRQFMLRHALLAFIEDGYEKASLRQIAARAEVSDSLLSYVFGSKEQLWYAVVDEVFGPLHFQQMSTFSALSTQPVIGPSNFQDALIFGLKQVLSEPLLLRFLHRESERNDDQGNYLRSRYLDPFIEKTGQLYALACEEQGVRPVSLATWAAVVAGICRIVSSPDRMAGVLGEYVQSQDGLDSFVKTVLEDLLPINRAG